MAIPRSALWGRGWRECHVFLDDLWTQFPGSLKRAFCCVYVLRNQKYFPRPKLSKVTISK